MLIVLLQLYWLSFGLIGLAGLLATRRVPKLWRSRFITYLRGTHPVLRTLLLWVLGLLPFLPVVVPSYIFQWPLRVLEAEYLVLLIAAVGVLIAGRKVLIRKLRWPRYSRAGFVLAVILAAALAYDYIVALRVGAPLYGDAPVQLAKITFFQQVHLALADPFYSNHGVVDPRYSTNFLDALQAVAAGLLHTTAVQVWKYSYGIYRLVLWLSIFSLLWTYLGRKYRHLAYPVTALLTVIWSGYFLFAVLPDRIVLAWAALLLLGIKLWCETGDWPLLIIAVALIASTHALFSLITLGYLALISAVLGVSRVVSVKRLAVPVACIMLLLLPVALNLYYPNRTNADKAAYVSGAISGTTPLPTHYGAVVLSKLPPVPFAAIAMCALFAAYVWFAGRRSNVALKALAYGAAFVGFVFAFRANVLAYAGYGLLLKQAGKRPLRLALAALFCYFALIIYNPLFWHVAGANIPPWVMARFQELNVFSPVAAILGTLFLAEWPLVRWGYARLRYVALALAALLLAGYFTWPTTNDYNITSIADSKSVQFADSRQQSLTALAQLTPYLHNQVVYSNDPNVNIRIPGITPANVYSFNPENESPMANIALRETCTLGLAKSLKLADLQAAGITRIITDSSYGLRVAALAKTRPYLRPLKETGTYQVYAVPRAPVPTYTPGKCAIPFGE
ncbi:MAG TPA: hypothetical protein VGM08_00030 [Candidatus Saccharimonadales bacterium]|jgi:hypothetical protein